MIDAKETLSFFSKTPKTKPSTPPPAAEIKTEGTGEPLIQPQGVKNEDKKIVEELEKELKTNEGSETVDVSGNRANSSSAGANGGFSANGNSVGDAGNDSKIYKVVVNGRLLLMGCDAIFPRGILFVAKEAGYKSDKKISDLMLTEKEIQALEPAADEVAKEIFQKMSPVMQLISGLSFIYGGKL